MGGPRRWGVERETKSLHECCPELRDHGSGVFRENMGDEVRSGGFHCPSEKGDGEEVPGFASA
eukprot:1926523-Heterocapsa_arctica.AAC.1